MRISLVTVVTLLVLCSFPSGMAGSCEHLSLAIAGVIVTQRHYDKAVKVIQRAHNDAIGAPKVLAV